MKGSSSIYLPLFLEFGGYFFDFEALDFVGGDFPK